MFVSFLLKTLLYVSKDILFFKVSRYSLIEMLKNKEMSH